jgi:hypothetical protein
MIKRYLILSVLFFAGSSFGDFLDDWSNDDLCGWMQSAATPEYIQLEVKKREVICYGGVEVSTLPNLEDLPSQNGTAFPSPDPSLIPVTSDNKDKSYSY